MKEVWKAIPGYEGLYEVSDLGRVKSLDRTVVFKDGRKRTYRGTILKPGTTGGYKYISLHKNKKSKNHYIHRLVVYSFIDNTLYNNNLTVNHKNLNKSDNTVDNLEVLSHRENNIHHKKNIKTKNNYIGVYKDPQCPNNPYRSYIRINGKKKFLGYFKTEKEASEAYNKELNLIKNET